MRIAGAANLATFIAFEWLELAPLACARVCARECGDNKSHLEIGGLRACGVLGYFVLIAHAESLNRRVPQRVLIYCARCKVIVSLLLCLCPVQRKAAQHYINYHHTHTERSRASGTRFSMKIYGYARTFAR